MRCGFRSFAAVGMLLGALLPVPPSSGLCADRPGAVQSPNKREAFARRVWAIVDLVLEYHVHPPTREEMILGGVNAALDEFKPGPRADLGRRVSQVKTARDLCALLDDIGPPASGSQGAALKQAADQFETTFLRGLLGAASGYPALVSANEARAQAQIQANRYVGIGVTVSADHGVLPRVTEVVPGGPADAAGIREGDVIEEVDHVAVAAGAPAHETVERVRGARGLR